MLIVGLTAIKVITAVLVIAVTGNYFRSLFMAFHLIKNKGEIDHKQIKRAKSLLLVGTIISWITAILIYYGEGILKGNHSEYSANLMYLVGVLLLAISIISLISAITVALSKVRQNRVCATTFKNLMVICFAFTIMLWSSIWFIS